MRSILRYLLCCSAAISAAGCISSKDMDEEAASAIRALDSTLANKEMIEAGKNSRIASLKAGISANMPQDELYWALNGIFNEYFQYNVDSAMFYAHRKIELAESMNDRNKIYDAILDIADRYAVSGMNGEALKQIELIDTAGLEPEFAKRRHSLLNTVYSNMIDSSSDPEMTVRYEKERDRYRKIMMESLDSTDIAAAYIGANILMGQGRSAEARDLLDDWACRGDADICEKGILSYMIAVTYRMEGNRDKAKAWYAKSASYDLQVPKYEYMSLIELAGMLYEDGDVERAYTYITRSVNDAVRGKAQSSKEDVFVLMPVIADSYDTIMMNKNTQMKYFLIILGLMLAAVVALTFVLLKAKREVTEAEMLTRQRNTQLNSLNEELKRYNILLQESGSIKDSYLGRYLNMCSDYIDGLDRYRSSIRKIAKEEGTAELLASLKSKEFMEKELEGFYAQFDATFLDLFPDFITQLNELLQEDKRIKEHSGNRILTTELRVLALIRLGVNDSVRIAHFLRRSVSTIYNYRVKMKNSAVIDREEFEKELMKIGKRI